MSKGSGTFTWPFADNQNGTNHVLIISKKTFFLRVNAHHTLNGNLFSFKAFFLTPCLRTKDVYISVVRFYPRFKFYFPLFRGIVV